MDSILKSIPNSQMFIQAANLRDLNALRKLEAVCFPKDAWPLIDLIGALSLPNVLRLKAVDEGRMVGFVAADLRPGQNLAWIATIGVLPEHRRRGVARALLLACEERVRVSAIRLNVRVSNKGALQLYHELGYAEVGIWPDYYEDKEDALVLEKIIAGARDK
jgi:ribosomal protein S18 acetylase RimI-like enzyme